MLPCNSKGGRGVVDAGILLYDSADILTSISIAPHHFITLGETNEVRFINRVVMKTIQKERVDWEFMVQISASGTVDEGLYGGTYGNSEVIGFGVAQSEQGVHLIGNFFKN